MRDAGMVGRGLGVVTLLVIGGLLSGVVAQEPRRLKIGTIGSLAPGGKGDAAESTLKDFIRSESNLAAEIVRQGSWQKLADQLADKTLQVGIFQGHEFVWAQQRRPTIKPMVLAVQGPRYPVIYLVIAKADTATDLAGLRGKVIDIPDGMESLRLYVEQLCQASGQRADAFFSKIVTQEFSEGALDDVVDGVAAAAVIDRGTLDTYKRRKPARFAKLKDLMHSSSLIPPIIAVADGSLDDAIGKQFQDGLINANKKDRGQSLLNAFKLSAFELPQADFNTIAKETLRTFPVPKSAN
jgi:ABC-type phosphate/phosphonate transport system substrate-binding protein